MDQINYTVAEKRITLGALMVVFLLGAMDNVIVSTALPRIMQQLHGIELYAWVGTVYMLTSTVTVPIYGKLGDLYSRKPILIAGVAIFLFGSALCGLSGEFGDLPLIGGGMAQLVVFRAIQGIGGGALFSSAFAIVAEIFSPRERGKYMGLLGAMFALASIIGPAVGGFLTDYATSSFFGYEIAGWRWVFYVNLPLGLIALALIIYKMPRLAHRAVGRVDYLGALLVVTTFVPLLLAFTWAGREYAWGSPRILSLLAVSAVSLVLFLRVEAHNPDAILPLELFRIRAFSATNLAGFMLGMSFFGTIMFMPLFLQAVLGVSATRSGFTMLPFMVGMLIGASGSGNLVSRIGKYKTLLLGGVALMFVGVTLLSQIGPTTSTQGVMWRMFMVGLGLGPTQSLFVMVIQNAVDHKHLGIATGSSQFFRQIGATIGIALFGTLLMHNLNSELATHVPQLAGGPVAKISLSEAQARVMNPQQIEMQIHAVLDRKAAMLAQAYQGDDAMARTVFDDPLIPAESKTALRSFMAADPASRPGAEVAIAAANTQLVAAATQLTERIKTGTRQAFSNAITALFAASLIIVALGFLLVLAIPELPLVDRTGKPVAVGEGAGH